MKRNILSEKLMVFVFLCINGCIHYDDERIHFHIAIYPQTLSYTKGCLIKKRQCERVSG